MVGDDQKFQFLLEQFKLHTEQTLGFQNERSKITTWTIIAIFGFYGWIVARPAADSLTAIAARVPPVFVLLGLLYVWCLNTIINRHSKFLDYLEYEMFSCGAETEWYKFKATGHSPKWLKAVIYIVWVLLFIATVLAPLLLCSK